VKRREFISLVGGAVALPISVRAQHQTGTVNRIGYLGSGSAVPLLLDAFRQGLHELGWVEGQNIVIDYRFAEGEYDRLPGLANELVRAASPTPAALAAKNATDTIPIVEIGFDNPVEHGLVASLARPGGNVTGLSYSVGPERN
jgi:putative tryptophan/tyrosine transport system substrate-binding protein